MITKIVKTFWDNLSKWWYHDIWSRSKIRDWYWWLEHRLNPGHRYHVIDTGLKPGFYDPETRILYAVMEEVCSFFENTCDVITYYDADCDGDGLVYDQSDIFMELLEIYEYWQWRKHFDSHFSGSECDQYKDPSTSIMQEPQEFWDCLDRLEEKDQHVKDLDQEMLKRAIDIRYSLWYP